MFFESLAFTPGVVVATQRAVDAKDRELRVFIRAYDRGVRAFLEEPRAYDEHLAESLGFPPGISDTIVTPPYHEARPPSEQAVADVSEWMVRTGMIDEHQAYEDVISRF